MFLAARHRLSPAIGNMTWPRDAGNPQSCHSEERWFLARSFAPDSSQRDVRIPQVLLPASVNVISRLARLWREPRGSLRGDVRLSSAGGIPQVLLRASVNVISRLSCGLIFLLVQCHTRSRTVPGDRALFSHRALSFESIHMHNDSCPCGDGLGRPNSVSLLAYNS